MCGHSAVTEDDDETLGERVFQVLLVAIFALLGLLLMVWLVWGCAGGLSDLDGVLRRLSGVSPADVPGRQPSATATAVRAA